MSVWVIEVVPLDVSTRFEQAGYFLDDGDWITVLHDEDQETEVDDVVFTDQVFWYGVEEVPVEKSDASREPWSGWSVREINVVAIEYGSGKLAGGIEEPDCGSRADVCNDRAGGGNGDRRVDVELEGLFPKEELEVEPTGCVVASAKHVVFVVCEMKAGFNG
jgi:hypothetical protein